MSMENTIIMGEMGLHPVDHPEIHIQLRFRKS